MQEFDWLTAIAIAGSVASILGLFAAAIQTARLRSLKRKRNAQIWGSIALALQAFERLEPLRVNSELLDQVSPEVQKRIIAARQSVVDQYLRLIEEAVLDEPDFSGRTIDLWVKSGRLENDWRREQALRFLPTNKIGQLK